MPMMRTITTKYFCRQCGWSTVVTNSYSDLTLDIDVLLNTTFAECPDCLSSDLGSREATFLESASPLNGARSTYYRAKLALKKSKGKK